MSIERFSLFINIAIIKVKLVLHITLPTSGLHSLSSPSPLQFPIHHPKQWEEPPWFFHSQVPSLLLAVDEIAYIDIHSNITSLLLELFFIYYKLNTYSVRNGFTKITP